MCCASKQSGLCPPSFFKPTDPVNCQNILPLLICHRSHQLSTQSTLRMEVPQTLGSLPAFCGSIFLDYEKIHLCFCLCEITRPSAPPSGSHPTLHAGCFDPSAQSRNLEIFFFIIYTHSLGEFLVLIKHLNSQFWTNLADASWYLLFLSVSEYVLNSYAAKQFPAGLIITQATLFHFHQSHLL